MSNVTWAEEHHYSKMCLSLRHRSASIEYSWEFTEILLKNPNKHSKTQTTPPPSKLSKKTNKNSTKNTQTQKHTSSLRRHKQCQEKPHQQHLPTMSTYFSLLHSNLEFRNISHRLIVRNWGGKMCNTGKNIPSVTTSNLRTAPQMFKIELFLIILTVFLSYKIQYK